MPDHIRRRAHQLARHHTAMPAAEAIDRLCLALAACENTRDRLIAATPAADHAHRQLHAIREARAHTCDSHCTEGGCDFDLAGFLDRVDEILAGGLGSSCRAQEHYPPSQGQEIPADQLQALVRQATDELLPVDVTAAQAVQSAYRVGYAAALGYKIDVVDGRVGVGDRPEPAASSPPRVSYGRPELDHPTGNLAAAAVERPVDLMDRTARWPTERLGHQIADQHLRRQT